MSLLLSKCHMVGNLMPWLICDGKSKGIPPQIKILNKVNTVLPSILLPCLSFKHNKSIYI